MIGAPARVDDDIGHDIGAGWFHQDVNPAPRAAPAHCVTDDPAHGIPGGDRSWPDQLLAFLQHDVGDLPWRGIDLEERAFGPGIFLDRIEECRALGLDRSEEHTSELQSLMRISYAVFCLKKKKTTHKKLTKNISEI